MFGIGYPLRFRALDQLTFRRGMWSANVFTNFQGGYRDTTSNPEREIRQWTTVEQLSVTITNKAIALLERLEASAGVHNVFDKDAPFVNNAAGLAYDPFNANLLGRYLTLGLLFRF
jgi:iron complex outermembrane recepter protein